MKKRLALLITPLLALVLTGCFGDSDVPDPTADLPYETFKARFSPWAMLILVPKPLIFYAKQMVEFFMCTVIFMI